MDFLNFKTPLQRQKDIANREAKLRKALGYSQADLAKHSGVSLGSLRRFEQTGEISLSSLLKLAYILDDAESFDQLFSKQVYKSIDEVIREYANQH